MDASRAVRNLATPVLWDACSAAWGLWAFRWSVLDAGTLLTGLCRKLNSRARTSTCSSDLLAAVILERKVAKCRRPWRWRTSDWDWARTAGPGLESDSSRVCPSVV